MMGSRFGGWESTKVPTNDSEVVNGSQFHSIKLMTEVPNQEPPERPAEVISHRGNQATHESFDGTAE
jgi:hypothetical protein